MLGEALGGKNTAPTFHRPSRPLSRPSDISFEAEMEQERSRQAAHGRRAAQREAYNAAGPAAAKAPQAPPAVTAQQLLEARSRNFGRNFADTFAHKLEGPTPPPLPPTAPAAPVELSRTMPISSRERSPRNARGAHDGLASSFSSTTPGQEPLGLSVGLLSLKSRGEGAGGSRASSGAGGKTAVPRGESQYKLQPATAAESPGNESSAVGEGTALSGSSRASGAGTASSSGGGRPTRMERAREWNVEVENAYRLQEAGYKDAREALSLGHPPLEHWPEQGFLRKLTTRETIGKDNGSMLYFSKRRECEDKELHRIKLYYYD